MECSETPLADGREPMKVTDTSLRVTATDLSNFLACRHLTRMDTALAHRRTAYPGLKDVGRDALASRGERHEDEVRARFLDRGWLVERIPLDWARPQQSAD